MRLDPEWGVFGIGFEQRISIAVDTGNEAINAVQALLRFNPKSTKVTSIDLSKTECSHIIEKSIDEKTGEIKIACIITKPNSDARTFELAGVYLIPKEAGISTLTFSPEETQVLANDGLGTNVLRATQGGSYRVDKFELSSSESTSSPFIVFSITHPNESRWYHSKKAKFIWSGNPKEEFRYHFGRTELLEEEDESFLVKGNRVEVDLPGNGVFYFHVQRVSDGALAHYRVNSDQVEPIITSFKVSEEKIEAGDVVRFSFDASDEESGIQKNYYIDLGDRLFLPMGKELYVPFLEPGRKKVTLRVYDEAQNYTEQSQIIEVLEKEDN